MKLNERYNQDSFTGFIQEFLPEDLVLREEDIVINKDRYKEITKAKILGFCESLDLHVLEMDHTHDKDPRVAIATDAFKILADHWIHRALVVFKNSSSGNYRLSYLTITLDLNDKNKVVKAYSNARRYSFYLGVDAKIKTAEQQLLNGGRVKSISELFEKFSVTHVTDEFFDEYKKLFIKIVNHLNIDQDFLNFAKKKEIDIHDVAKKLLGQIAFLYFLQKKGWLGAGKNDRIDNGDPKFVRNLFAKYQTELVKKEAQVNFNFFNDYLEYLFYDALNIESEYSTNSYRDRFEVQIPFLNGGLFQPIGGYPWKEKFLKIPDDILSNKENDGILDVFDQYNFTVDENSTNDQEISVDPEMLGKVFERLLDTRKLTGAFYTPREIVSYMVRESLVKYLKDKTNLDDGFISHLVNEHYIPDCLLNKDSLRKIDEALQAIRILDPAVGSGAFPVGLLQEMAAIRSFCETNYKMKPRTPYEIKNDILENNLFGVDIDTGAVEIARLRFWLSLVVDTDVSEIRPLPNLEFKLVAANSLIQPKDTTKTAGLLDDSKLLEKMQELREKFFRARTKDSKDRIKEDFEKLILRTNHLFASDEQKRMATYHPFDQSKAAAFFDHEFMFGVKNFDLVIGNPPYGGEKIDDVLKAQLGLASKDMYAAFMSRSITGKSPFLKEGGNLSLIVSDTFMILKSHHPLRKHLLKKTINRMIRLHSDTFKATVNTAIVFIENKLPEVDQVCEMADLTNISVHENYDMFQQVLSETKQNSKINISNDKYAIYYYPQSLISQNSNEPFFVGSPKLFRLIVDAVVVDENIIEDTQINFRKIDFNEKKLQLVRFGDVADVKVGLQTGDNNYYLFQNPDVRGNYKNINDYKEFLLTNDELEQIAKNEVVRIKIIKRGFIKCKTESNFDKDLWFEGKYIIPYDKGGESDATSGWLPNYHVPTNYFIDWSEEALRRMNKLTIAERNKLSGKPGGSSALCAVIRNSDSYFKPGVTFSRTGVYSPTFRLGSVSTYDTEGSTIVSKINSYALIGFLSSKLNKFFCKTYLGHTVHTQVDELKETVILMQPTFLASLEKLVQKIVEHQRNNLRYDYMSNEQKEIDKIVYQAFGLDPEDVQEVEKWYARRYPKLRKWCYID